jgi:hypothetical protein
MRVEIFYFRVISSSSHDGVDITENFIKFADRLQLDRFFRCEGISFFLVQ